MLLGAYQRCQSEIRTGNVGVNDFAQILLKGDME
jgi:hypothetical protein